MEAADLIGCTKGMFNPGLKVGEETTRSPRVNNPEGPGSRVRDYKICDVEWGQAI